MKLKNKLYISFCIMVILPVLLSGLWEVCIVYRRKALREHIM